MNVIIFSYNRYSQLELLLTSLNKHSRDNLNISILYQEREDILPVKKTQDKIVKKFSKLKNISSIKTESSIDFKKDVIRLLDSGSEHILFCSDSNIIYRPIDFGLAEKSLQENKNVVCFSLRLGRNITHCYNTHTDNNLYGVEDDGEELIKWFWNKAYLDFGYPFSFDGHIFRTKEIKQLIKNARGKTPVELEDGLQIFDTFPKGEMMAFKESVLVSRADVLEGAGEMRELTIRYAGGARLVYTNSYFKDVDAVIKEINLKYK